jgi:polyphosphate kinase
VRSVTHDVYFDSEARTLERRGVTCRLRTFENGARSLAVAECSLLVGVDGVPDTITEAEIEHHGEGSLFEDSPPERRLRELVDAAVLAPMLEVTTERFRRCAPHGLLRRPTVECDFDTVTVRVGGRSRALYEAAVRPVGEADDLARSIASRWAERHPLRSPEATRFSRVRRAAASVRRDALAARLGVEVVTVVIVARDGMVACFQAAGELRLPSRAGSGFGAATQLADACGGAREALVQLDVPIDDPSLVDVWVDRSARPPNSAGSAEIAWVPLVDLMTHAGAPFATDGPTLAALGILLSSTVGDDILGATEIPGAPLPAGLEVAPGTMLDAELSLIDFNARVLTMAEDRTAALHDRLRMLAITCANADEFVMVRLAELRAKAASSVADADTRMAPAARLDAARLRLAALGRRQAHCLEECIDAFASAGLEVRRWTELDTPQREHLRDWFADMVATRIATGGMTLVLGHPFPRLPHLTLSLCVIGRERTGGAWRLTQFDLPRDEGRFVGVPETNDLIPLEEIARGCADVVYADLEIAAVYAFRVIREGDLTLSEGDDLFDRVSEAARRRAFNHVVRVEVERTMPPAVREALLATLQVEPGIADNALTVSDLYASPGPLAMVDARELIPLARRRAIRVDGDVADDDSESGRGAQHDMSDDAGAAGAAHVARGTRASIGFGELESLWTGIAARDRLMHHPYTPYDTTVLRFFQAAADDPLVQSIRVTLYRVGDPSPVVDALLAARAAGKRVFVYVELTARFDETRNLSWVTRLEDAGVSVACGRGDLKCHAKVALVERLEHGVLNRYAHIGTGNYNATSARTYTDFSLLTADPRVTSDLDRFFSWLADDQRGKLHCDHCLVAPVSLLDGMLARIEREISHARAGRVARIRLKLNALSERDLVRALYTASQSGVEIDLIVRGICTLRPGVPGLSDRIRVASRIGRFLEHGRIYHFANDGDDDYYLGSADWRPRNMRRRVEIVTPVFDWLARAQLAAILDAEIADPAHWRLDSHGVYVAPPVSAGASADERFVAVRRGSRSTAPERVGTSR